MIRHRFGLGLAITLAMGMSIAACGDDEPLGDGAGVEVDAAVPETGRADTGSSDGGAGDSGGHDTGTKDAGPKDADADAEADADAPGPAPGTVTDLAGTVETHATVKITWTAPPEPDDGVVAAYEVRYSTSPITTPASFLLATQFAAVPLPEAPGTAETVSLTGLAPKTQYYVALRATFEDGTAGPISNVVTLTTKPRAMFRISEVAPANSAATGGDFVELVAVEAGSAAGLQIFSSISSPLYTLGPLDVQFGDRIVIHTSGLPGPAGFVQEDTTSNKASSTAANASADAYDVYSAVTDLPITAGAIFIADGELLNNPDAVQDMVPYASRTPVESFETYAPAIFGFMFGHGLGRWVFSVHPDEWESSNYCAAFLDVVNASGNEPPDCGGPPGTVTDGRSIQLTNVYLDTNTPGDFTVAPQTRGAPN